MEEHPIENLMLTAMSSIQDMIDVNTIIGEPIETSNGITIIPISKVGFGFAAGGSEFNSEAIKEYNKKDKDEEIKYKVPFGGGAGAGVSINPVAFLVVENNNVKLIPIAHNSCIDRLLDYVPDLMEKIDKMFNKSIKQKEERNKQIVDEIRKRASKTNENADKDKSTNKEKSQEVMGQEKKVEENEDMAGFEEVSSFFETDGET